MTRPAGGRRGRASAPRRYPRSARVNETLREILAEAIEKMADRDERLGLATVTAVQCDPDLRRALVLMSSLRPGAAEALEEVRVRLQASVARQVRWRHTPQLRFEVDPAVVAGQRIEEILHHLDGGPDAPDAGPAEE